MVAGTNSGCGKTTVLCALLAAFRSTNTSPSAFKCGPDYIDPMFHQKAFGVSSRNLDLFLNSREMVRYLFAKNSFGSDLALLEGVMGYYDGLGANSTVASAYDLAQTLCAPTVLVIGCRGASVSIAAEIKGFCDFRPDANIRGVLLNQLSPMLYPRIREFLEHEFPNIKVIGYLPPMPDCSLKSRHLGLVTADELKEIYPILERLGETIKKTVDLSLLVRIAREAAPYCYEKPSLKQMEKEFCVAVARDKAFSFYYEDNLTLLQELGAKLCFFSPLGGDPLPPQADGLWLGGGYPELYASRLSQNAILRRQIRQALEDGMPTIAECGGFLYLGRSLQTQEGERFDMVGALPFDSYPTGKLVRFGYKKLIAKKDGLLLKAGEMMPSHEFHYWDATDPGDGLCALRPGGQESCCGYVSQTMYAGFPHLHLYGNLPAAERFAAACAAYREKRGKDR